MTITKYRNKSKNSQRSTSNSRRPHLTKSFEASRPVLFKADDQLVLPSTPIQVNDDVPERESHNPDYLHVTMNVPVLIACKEVQFHISSVVETPHPIQEICSVNWSVQFLMCRTATKDKTVFIQCLLRPAIQYVPRDSQVGTQEIRHDIQWNVATPIEFLSPPVESVQTEVHLYSFGSYIQNEQQITHREQRERIVDAPYCVLKEWTIVSTEEIQKNRNEHQILIQGSVTLSFDVLQMQQIRSETPHLPKAAVTTGHMIMP